MILISTTEDSPTKIETPSAERELMERFKSDLHEEMSNLAKQFPQFQPLADEMFEWEQREMIELSAEERNRFKDFENRLLNVVASSEELVRGFEEAIIKVLIKNIELFETINRFVKLYESLVSKNILLLNPFDLLDLTEEGREITLKFRQTDSVLDKYEDITLPKIKLVGSKAGKFPVYRLFEWG